MQYLYIRMSIYLTVILTAKGAESSSTSGRKGRKQQKAGKHSYKLYLWSEGPFFILKVKELIL